MTRGGYISDQTCPTNREHGRCYDTPTGWFCPHEDHHINNTQFHWRDDEWESLKSLPTEPTATDNVKIKLERPGKRLANRSVRRPRKANRAKN